MSNLNTRQTEQWIPFLIARDGPICNTKLGHGCGKPLYELMSKVNIDHVDNNVDNNPKDGSNYQLLCHSCNVKKELTKLETKIEDRPYTPEMKKNLKAEPKWTNWMINEIIENHSVCYGEAINNGASIVGVSPETTKRYLKKRLGKDGLFELGWGKCSSVLCDETHIYDKGQAPRMEQ